MQLLSLNYGKNVIRYLLLALMLVVSQSANATLITYDLDHVTGNTYQYNYTVHNSLAFDIDYFVIYFSHPETENLASALPADWDPIIAEPDPFFGDGFVEWFTLGSGIAQSDTLSGFSVQFDWLGGPSGPSSQSFDVFDPFTFDILDSGQTSTVAVPEPATIPLFLLGLIWLKRKSIFE